MTTSGNNVENSKEESLLTDELSMDEGLLKKLNEVVKANLKNEQFSVEDLASEVALSRSHLHRKLSKLTGESSSQFIRNIRLNHALELLKKEVGTVSEISFRVGFSSSSYFIKCFNQRYGFSPGEVKRMAFEESGEKSENNVSEGYKPEISPLEAFHPASESLIREIFEELIVHKSSLAKHLIANEENGEFVDVRLLAYQIIRGFPWPIGVELRRLFSAELKSQNELRLEHINRTIEKCLKVISYSYVGELTNSIDKIKPDKINLNHVISGLEDPSRSKLIEMILAITRIRKSDSFELLISEFDHCFDAAFFRELMDWNENEAKGSSEESIDSRCSSVEQTLVFMLKKIAFLVKYKLVNVSNVSVNKPRFEEASFEHEFHVLNNSDTDFFVKEERLSQYSDSNAVLLMKSMKDPTAFLNLHPLIIDTNKEDSSLNLNFRFKRDIFLFEGLQDQAPVFRGSDINGVLVFDNSDYGDTLKADLDKLIKKLGDGK